MDRLAERIRILVPSLDRPDGSLPGVELAGNTGSDLVIVAWDVVAIGRAKPTDAELLAVALPDLAAAKTAKLRTFAKDLLDDPDAVSILLRALALVILDENNTLRQWVTSFKAATAAATTLADLKTRVAALANLPDRTKAQIMPAIRSKIDGGTADTST